MTRTGRLSLEQKTFRALCAFCSIPFADTYGRDEPIGILESWGVVRRQVGSPVTYQPRDDAAEIRRRAAEGQSVEGIAASSGMRPVEVEAFLTEATHDVL